MTRKDYEKVAKIIAEENFLGKAAKLGMARKFAAMFLQDNPKFDEYRFLQACGVVG